MAEDHRRLLRSVAALAAVGTLLLAACGDDDTGSGDPSTDAGSAINGSDASVDEGGDVAAADAVEACELFDDELAEQFLGSAVTVGVDETFTFGQVQDSECSYGLADGSTEGIVSASVGVVAATSADGRSTNRDTFADRRQTSFGIDGDAASAEVAGAGDNAFWDGTNHRVWVLVDDGAYVIEAGVQVGFDMLEDGAEAKASAELAELMLEEL